MALVSWGDQAQLETFETEVVVIVPKGRPDIMTELETVCANYPDWSKLERRDDETFFTLDTKPNMGRRAYDHVLGVGLSHALYIASPAGRFRRDYPRAS